MFRSYFNLFYVLLTLEELLEFVQWENVEVIMCTNPVSVCFPVCVCV